MSFTLLITGAGEGTWWTPLEKVFGAEEGGVACMG